LLIEQKNQEPRANKD